MLQWLDYKIPVKKNLARKKEVGNKQTNIKIQNRKKGVRYNFSKEKRMLWRTILHSRP